jgi:hypothetical protein
VLSQILGEAAADVPEVALFDDGRALGAALGAVDVDVVLAAWPDPRDGNVARRLFAESAAIRVVLLTDSGKEAVIYDLSSDWLEAVDMSAAELLHVLRRGLAPAASPIRRAIGDLW